MTGSRGAPSAVTPSQAHVLFPACEERCAQRFETSAPMSKPSETAEKVRGEIRSPVSRQQISLDVLAEAVRRAVWTSQNRVDRIAAGEIDFFSGLVEKQTSVASRNCEVTSRGLV